MASELDRDDDDYITQLLTKEAKEASRKYAAQGIQALLPQRPTNAAPKPNTRFLKNIIRETDTHNAALKRKEQLEARARLKAVARPHSTRKDEDEDAEVRHRKRRRVDQDGDEERRRRRLSSPSGGYGDQRRHRRTRDTEERQRRTNEDDSRTVRSNDRDVHHSDKRYRTNHSHRYESREAELPGSSSGHGIHRRERRRRSRSQESSRSPDQKHRHRRREEGHVRHRRRRRSSSASHRSQSPHRHRQKSTIRNSGERTRSPTLEDAHRRRSPSASRATDSDPLEALVGPLPAPNGKHSGDNFPPSRPRGRGSYRASGSAMDEHFSANYDPSLDLHPDSEPEGEKEDWDMALEALRDRELWKRKGAERLRAAGFAEDEVKKWENSGKERSAADVSWAGKGQAREWDLGKVVEPEGARKGEVHLEAAWKRKGGFMNDFKKALG